MKEIVDIIGTWECRRTQSFALATLVKAQGSSYRRPGARMLICSDRTTAGSLSGGCLEEAVAARALEVLGTGIPSLMKFDTRLRFGCNGSIEILVEMADSSFLSQIAAHIKARSRYRIATLFGKPGEKSGSRILLPNETAPGGAFVQQLQPPIQLILFGHGPDTAPFFSFAKTLGWNIIEVDEASDLPQRVDDRSAVLVKSHNYGRDFAALQRLLSLNLRYLGLLGPRQRRDQLLHALMEAGVAIDSELFSPAGLDLGAETPEEIALAIVAEINAVFADASGESLRDRKAPIHGWNLAPSPATRIEEWAVSGR